MPDKKKDYWFPARTYGWGWGLPSVWQGWLVYGIGTVLLAAGVFIFPASHESWPSNYTGVSCLLVAVCWAKGEPPRWRLGEK